MLDIASTAKISPLADLEVSQRGTALRIGAHSVIDSFVKVKPAGGSGDVVIGEHSHINSGTVIYSGNGLHIGDHVLVAANCTFAPVNHNFSDRDRLIAEQGFSDRGGIVVEDDVWIGANCVILDGARIPRGCVIAAGSVVRGELEPYSINAGQPAVCTGYRQSS